MPRWVLSAGLLTLIGLLCVSGPAASLAEGGPPLPNSMAAIGDSISQAADVCCWYGDHPSHAWSTGDSSTDQVVSHYERILAANPSISGNAHNDSVSGAKMADAASQASAAVSQGAEYVTILMGANDVCTSTIAGMTPVDTFRAQFQGAMDTLEAGLPSGAHIFVSSIPNIYRLWKLFHTNLTAQAVWWAARICQSMLSPSNSRQDRMTVLQREQDFNAVLEQVCGQYGNCMFDGYATFQYRFTTGQVSKLDYFHPSLSGQAGLADVTWTVSWWPVQAR
jgi:lysophospholipase L1-like esterase